MKTLILLSVISCIIGLGPPAAYAAVDVSDWGTWTYGTSNSLPQFNLTRGNVEWATSWAAEDDRNTYHKAVAGGWGNTWSGGEWYDHEGLYMDVVTKGDGKTYLEWLFITSYAGVESDEWSGYDANGAGGTVNHSGSFAAMREWSVPYEPGGAGQTTPWAFRSTPVIAISLDNKVPDQPPLNWSGGNIPNVDYEWALVLDNQEPNGKVKRSSVYATPNDITTNATLYQIATTGGAGAVDKWKQWQDPTSSQFEQTGPSDLDTSATNVNAVRWTNYAGGNGYSNKRIDTAYKEIYNTGGVKQQAKQGTAVAANRMDFNWIWKGSMDITGAGFIKTGTTAVHTAMWCGNDYMHLTDGGFNTNQTPELSSGALLLLGMLPVGLGWWRRRKIA